MDSVFFKDIGQALSKLEEDDKKGYILHVPISMIHELSKSCNENIVLVSSSGVYSKSGFSLNGISGFSYDKNMVEIVEINEIPILSKNQLENAYKKVKNNKEAFMMLLLDGLSGNEESVMTTLYFMNKDFKIIGGSAGDDLAFEETAIYIGSKRVKHVAAFFDMRTKTQLIKENIYAPIGEKLLITEADPVNRIVYKINNQPAATEYAKLLGISESKLSDSFMNNPLGKIYENEILIASPMKVNSDKSITFYCQVMPNTFVYMLEPVDVVSKVRETLDTLSFKPSFLYAVNCILRSLMFQSEGLWKNVDSCLLETCSNTTGFVSYGEQFYRHHINQTMIVLAVQ